MRDYDPTTGRYIQADPLGLVDGASVYGYALQNPGRWTDPRGEQSLDDSLKFTLCLINPLLCQSLQQGIPVPEERNQACFINEDDCDEHYKACLLTRLADKGGSVYGESRCQSCYWACKSKGYWPSSVPSVRGGALTCRYRK